mgnify:CR=1 FL=1
MGRDVTKAGRGSENKIPFVIAVSTTEDNRPMQMVASRVPGFTSEAIRSWAQIRLTPESDVCNDGLACFSVLSDLGHAYTAHIAKRRESSRCPGMPWVNTVLGNIKRSIDSSYHSFRFAKYSQRYLSEAMWRFNRRFNLATMVPTLLSHIAQSRPLTEAQLRVQNAYY